MKEGGRGRGRGREGGREGKRQREGRERDGQKQSPTFDGASLSVVSGSQGKRHTMYRLSGSLRTTMYFHHNQGGFGVQH